MPTRHPFAPILPVLTSYIEEASKWVRKMTCLRLYCHFRSWTYQGTLFSLARRDECLLPRRKAAPLLCLGDTIEGANEEEEGAGRLGPAQIQLGQCFRAEKLMGLFPKMSVVLLEDGASAVSSAGLQLGRPSKELKWPTIKLGWADSTVPSPFALSWWIGPKSYHGPPQVVSIGLRSWKWAKPNYCLSVTIRFLVHHLQWLPIRTIHYFVPHKPAF